MALGIRIHQVRSIHSTGQRSYLWEFSFQNVSGWSISDLERLTFLAARVSFPGIQGEDKPYFIGGHEHYTLGRVRRGGPVTASFIEVEGSLIDKFFRQWINERADPKHTQGIARARVPKDQYSLTATVTLISRQGESAAVFTLRGLIPIRLGGYEMTYDGSGMLLLPVEMRCDEVERSSGLE